MRFLEWRSTRIHLTPNSLSLESQLGPSNSLSLSKHLLVPSFLFFLLLIMCLLKKFQALLYNKFWVLLMFVLHTPISKVVVVAVTAFFFSGVCVIKKKLSYGQLYNCTIYLCAMLLACTIISGISPRSSNQSWISSFSLDSCSVFLCYLVKEKKKQWNTFILFNMVDLHPLWSFLWYWHLKELKENYEHIIFKSLSLKLNVFKFKSYTDSKVRRAIYLKF